jgi:hypothetical protein
MLVGIPKAHREILRADVVVGLLSRDRLGTLGSKHKLEKKQLLN